MRKEENVAVSTGVTPGMKAEMETRDKERGEHSEYESEHLNCG
jgi:hypothetical protein